MRTTLLFKLMFLFTLSAGWYWLSVKPQPAYAMPCCKDLHCEATYQNCISYCYEYGDQSCMDNCQTQAVSCAMTNCEIDCGGSHEPCWFDFESWDPYCGEHGNYGEPCFTSSDCRAVNVCLDETCYTGGCFSDPGCGVGSGHHCDGGFCFRTACDTPGSRQECPTLSECSPYLECVRRSCSGQDGCPQGFQCIYGYCY